MIEAPADILKSLEHPDDDLAAPTPDHFIPRLHTAGLAAEKSDAKSRLQGHALGSLSMTSCGADEAGMNRKEALGAATLPQGVPPDRTTICPRR